MSRDPVMTPAHAATIRALNRIDDAHAFYQRRTVNGHVYFVRHGVSGPIKIGWATEIDERIAELQVGNPERLELLGSRPGTISDERSLHRQFAEHRLRGEWFSPHADLLAYIREL